MDPQHTSQSQSHVCLHEHNLHEMIKREEAL